MACASFFFFFFENEKFARGKIVPPNNSLKSIPSRLQHFVKFATRRQLLSAKLLLIAVLVSFLYLPSFAVSTVLQTTMLNTENVSSDSF